MTPNIRIREYCTSGSVRGAARKGSPYRGGVSLRCNCDRRGRISDSSEISPPETASAVERSILCADEVID